MTLNVNFLFSLLVVLAFILFPVGSSWFRRKNKP
jgi:hypothetical protein